MTTDFDLIVIGGGPGGYVAALRGAQLGLRTALIEKDEQLGGTCLLRGCIPTKALLHAAEVWRLCSKGARTFGIDVPEATFDWTRIQKRRSLATVKGSKGVALLLKEAEVTVLRGYGRLDGAGRVLIEGEDVPPVVTAPKIVLATGSTPAGLPGVEVDGHHILNSDHLLAWAEVPASMIVLGAGAVGVELASVMQSFGCRVTLVEIEAQVLPLEDTDCAAEVAQALKGQGMKICTSTRAREITTTAEGVKCVLDDRATGVRTEVEAACLLAAVGRRPLTRDLGLDTVDVVVDRRGYLQVDSAMQTPQEGLYAIGDIVPTPHLAHVASHEALVAVNHAAGQTVAPVRYNRVPSCLYSHPEVASVGLTETAARQAGHLVKCGRFPFSALGKASILNEPRGFIKVVSDQESGQVLGVHMVGARVTEMIAAATTAFGFGADLETWTEVIHPHPTLSEALGEALLAAAGRPLHGGGP
ncbi:MAG: dihydrolipoyl dehydrogenase [Candidatus Krumholzibacteria bacterium]|nr:dihydrolipoyl dehydrogenase [Candidatus Krumholzibacteria bacterium]